MNDGALEAEYVDRLWVFL